MLGQQGKLEWGVKLDAVMCQCQHPGFNGCIMVARKSVSKKHTLKYLEGMGLQVSIFPSNSPGNKFTVYTFL